MKSRGEAAPCLLSSFPIDQHHRGWLLFPVSKGEATPFLHGTCQTNQTNIPSIDCYYLPEVKAVPPGTSSIEGNYWRAKAPSPPYNFNRFLLGLHALLLLPHFPRCLTGDDEITKKKSEWPSEPLLPFGR